MSDFVSVLWDWLVPKHATYSCVVANQAPLLRQQCAWQRPGGWQRWAEHLFPGQRSVLQPASTPALGLDSSYKIAHSFPYMLLRASPAPTCWVSTINSVNALHTCCLNPPTGSGAGYWATPIWTRAVQYQRWGGPRNSRYSDLVLRPYDHQYLSPCEVLSVPAIRV